MISERATRVRFSLDQRDFLCLVPRWRDGGYLRCEFEQIGFGRTVLIGEAEEIVYKTMVAILERAGFRVFIAIDTELASDIFDQHGAELALIVVDLALPRIGGHRFVEHLATLSPRIPVLFMTAMGAEEVPESIKGRYAVLHKPFTAEGLVVQVNRLLCCQL